MKITRCIIINITCFLLFLSNLSFGQTLFPFIGEKLSEYHTKYEFSYTADFLGSKQGTETRSYYHDNINLVFDTDLEKLISWSGAAFHLYVLGNNGDLINNHLGTIQWVNNISAVIESNTCMNPFPKSPHRSGIFFSPPITIATR